MSSVPLPDGGRGLVADWSSDRQAFHVSWGKAMMWIFLLSDTFIFGSFLTGYMTVRASITTQWPNPSEVFALHVGATQVPLLLIAIMTFVLITSSGTMAMAVNCAYSGQRANAAALMVVTAAFGEMFVLMQAFEWSKLLLEGMRPWENPWGAAQFGSVFFMITGFHGLHVTGGVILLLLFAHRVLQGRADASTVEIVGLYWHFVDLVWVFIFAFFYLW